MSTIKVTNINNASASSGGIAFDADGHVTVDGLQLPSAGTLSNRNLIINGAMQVAQRGNVDVTAGGGTTFTATDRYGLLNYWGSGQVGTSLSTEAPTGFDNSLELEVDTAAPMSGSTGYSCTLCQTIEGYNIRNAYTGSATLTFWVRSSVTGTYSVTFSNSSTSISLGDRLYVTEYTINAANTWEKKTITVDLSAGVASGTWNTTNGAGLGIHWNLGAESNLKGDTHLDAWGTLAVSNIDIQSADQVNWISTASATFYITGVQLEVGSTATPFEHRSYGDELARCQRYYAKTYNNSVVPGTVSGPGILVGIVTSANFGYVNFVFPVDMRPSPTITLYNSATGATGTWRDGGNTDRAVTATSVGTTSCSIYVTTAAASSSFYGHAVASSEL